ncbi:hypothetical protein [Cesiribacter andamanensis]|uniref:Uncharacterized protein n=1 Tax=Cesiribacter andamanensis AMV16 TaxID=1279009 RepID=M7N4I5_9BACT|nr:hypothetical protein [Cesiribacter andamanensis]EMR02141.1 hypothetical protein ADICEAN_02703 [Cesiribacter andamanensis AMV16]
MKRYLYLLAGLLLMAGCQPKDEFQTSPLRGSWVEVAPHFGHASSISFISADEALVNYWTGDGYEKHPYTYRLDEQGAVVLTSKGYGSQFRGVFNEAGDMGIECFYPCIPEYPPVTLFRKGE